jgi:hypothetical protein
MEVVMSCMMDEEEVVVEGGPARAVRTVNLGGAPPDPGRNDMNVRLG